ncbi:MAG TPA: ZIP family metal transporter [Candidatus Paceibacterota bacterium]|nr:ZIP family metal transporter [Candidatus Paceibacterota bacterium]
MHYELIITIAVATGLATMVGGLFALRFKDKLHLILGFSAGAVIAVAFFDLLPEAISLGADTFSAATIITFAAVGFFAFMVLDRFVFFHGCATEGHHHDHTGNNGKGNAGAGTLSLHSFLDGLAIGLSFQVSVAVGAIVTAAVLTHDFSDGINTVNLVVKNGGDKTRALRWLIVDAGAPIIGIIATFFFHVPEATLGIILALFSGFFLYIGASDLLPESHHAHPTVWTTIATLLGVLVLYGAIYLARI